MGNAFADRQRYDRQNSAYHWSVDPKSDGQTETVNLKAHTECGAAPKAVGTFYVALDTLYANQSSTMDDGDHDLRALNDTVGSITKQTKGKRLKGYRGASGAPLPSDGSVGVPNYWCQLTPQ